MARKRQYWLMKSEPESYGIDDLERDGKTPWEGVRNYQARNFMRDEMRDGDLVLFYHSNAKPPGVAGVGKVTGKPYPDPTAQDPDSPYHDHKATPDNPIWMLVDIAFVEKFPHFVSRELLQAEPDLTDMAVLQRGSRLSITPVEPSHFELVRKLGRAR